MEGVVGVFFLFFFFADIQGDGACMHARAHTPSVLLRALFLNTKIAIWLFPGVCGAVLTKLQTDRSWLRAHWQC